MVHQQVRLHLLRDIQTDTNNNENSRPTQEGEEGCDGEVLAGVHLLSPFVGSPLIRAILVPTPGIPRRQQLAL